ncbi:MAG: 7-carboxy-7-deazaguanine synthase QueE [Bacteroidota bacterium]|nr:7-carboxy-7-deazaguanine synthase QueE [Bacteroidota bacterium]
MSYRVNEIFLTRQGEGFNQGKKVIFIRLSGCNLACEWCDTDFKDFTVMEVAEILKELQHWDCRAVIITGGEPTIQNLGPLTETLKKAGYWIGIESNATRSLEPVAQYLDYIALSPKRHAPVGQFKASEVRVVNDGLATEDLLKYERLIDAERYYISPLDIDGKMNILECMELLAKINILSSKGWQISLQLHKLAGIP